MSFGVSMTCFQSQELAYLYSKSNFCYDVFKKSSNFCSVSILSMGVLREPINAKPSQTCCYTSDMSFGVSMPCFQSQKLASLYLKANFSYDVASEHEGEKPFKCDICGHLFSLYETETVRVVIGL